VDIIRKPTFLVVLFFVFYLAITDTHDFLYSPTPTIWIDAASGCIFVGICTAWYVFSGGTIERKEIVAGLVFGLVCSWLMNVAVVFSNFCRLVKVSGMTIVVGTTIAIGQGGKSYLLDKFQKNQKSKK